MITYKTSDWLEPILIFHTGNTARSLLRRLLVVALYVTVVVTVEIRYIDTRLKYVPSEYLSALGILLSLLLVFRINTAYDRFYEGRRAWGTLVNTVRNIAVLLGAILPRDDRNNRFFFARVLANFPYALRNRLRSDKPLADLDASPDLPSLATANHVPMCVVSQLRSRVEQLAGEGAISGAQSINLNALLVILLDVAGICERIRSTPIPFTYNLFIKLFITTYVMLLPFVIVDELGYLTIPAVLITSYVMIGLELIGEEIEDPFGTDRNDLPLTQLSQMMRVNIYEGLDIQPPLEEMKLAQTSYIVVS